MLGRFAVGGRRFEFKVVASTSTRSEEHTSELQSLRHLVCRLLLEKKKKKITNKKAIPLSLPISHQASMNASSNPPPQHTRKRTRRETDQTPYHDKRHPRVICLQA